MLFFLTLILHSIYWEDSLFSDTFPFRIPTFSVGSHFTLVSLNIFPFHPCYFFSWPYQIMAYPMSRTDHCTCIFYQKQSYQSCFSTQSFSIGVYEQTCLNHVSKADTHQNHVFLSNTLLSSWVSRWVNDFLLLSCFISFYLFILSNRTFSHFGSHSEYCTISPQTKASSSTVTIYWVVT